MTGLDSPSESDAELEDDVSDGIFRAVVEPDASFMTVVKLEPDAFFTTVDSESESSELRGC